MRLMFLFYEEKYGTTFKPIVITNRTFTNEAHRLSRTNASANVRT